MMPISYSLPEVVERNFADLVRHNGLTIEIPEDGNRFRTSDGEEAFVLSDGMLETSFSLPEGEDMRLHAALISSGAAHFGADSMKLWPRRILVNGLLNSVPGGKG